MKFAGASQLGQAAALGGDARQNKTTCCPLPKLRPPKTVAQDHLPRPTSFQWLDSGTTMAPQPTSPATAAPTAAQAPAKPQSPIQILSAPSAQTYSHVHPLLVLSVFAVRFSALVQDPQSTLLSILPVIAVLQGVYAVLCLPAAGRESGSSTGGSKPRGKKRGDNASGNGIGGKITVQSPCQIPISRIPLTYSHQAAILSLTLPLLLGTPLLTLLLILFGAPLTTHLPHTILCAAHISVLAGTSLVYIHGTDSAAWHEIWGMTRALDTVWGSAVGAGVGAWVGAVPIPLDW